MVPPSLPPALRQIRRLPAVARIAAVLVVGMLAGMLLAPALLLAPLTTSPAYAASADQPVEPLSVTIETLTPGEVPRVGTIEVSGTVTNLDDQTWTTINLYPFMGETPMTTSKQLRVARATDVLEPVGERITDPGPYATIDRLEPGESADFSFTVARSRLPASAPGVYWFGVHALGADADGVRPTSAVGRARTFLPLVDTRDRTTVTVPLALVVPLRRPLLHAPDGSVDQVTSWARALADDGKLGALARLGEAADGAPLTWLVDPALTDAATRLAAGNPARSLEPTVDPADAEGEDSSGATDGSPSDGSSASSGASGSATPPEPSETTSPEPVDPDDLADLDPATREAATAANRWLALLAQAVQPGQQVLALPYGDLDVAGAVEHAPSIYEQARRRSGSGLAGLDVSTDPGIASPQGYLDATAVAGVEPDETLIVTDDELGRRARTGTAPTVVSIDGRRVVLASSGAAQGGPGPGDPLSTVGLRQRILSEAAVRSLRGGADQPLVVVLPAGWTPDRPSEFVPGLRTDWLRLSTVADAVAQEPSTAIDPEELHYPERQARAELGQTDFAAVERLVETGRTLERVLTLNDQVGSVVAAEAYASASYTSRSDREAAVRSDDEALGWIRALLGQVRVTTPSGVTLSSDSGRLPATIVNGIDQPVTVSLDARSDLPMTFRVPTSIEVPANGRVGVLLDASTDRQGVHNVTLMVTDSEGQPLGGQASLPIRAAQVSDVIWLIIGTGAVLLFGAIGLRVVRRVREARREAATG